MVKSNGETRILVSISAGLRNRKIGQANVIAVIDGNDDVAMVCSSGKTRRKKNIFLYQSSKI